jgi:hypothetical protein
MTSLCRRLPALTTFLLCVLFFQPNLFGAAVPTITSLEVTSAGTRVTTVAAGTVVTLTAAVKSASGSPTVGRVNFCDAAASYCTDIYLLGTAQLTSAGTAVMKFVPGIGKHAYKAVFAGTPNGTGDYEGSTSKDARLTVTGKFATSAALVSSGAEGDYTLTATIDGLVNSTKLAAPAGAVSFLDTSDNNQLLGTATLGAGSLAMNFIDAGHPVTNPYPQSVSVADFNGDGKLDLAVPVYSFATPAPDVNIFLGNGNGTFTAAPALAATGQNVNNAAVADFNGDGKPDLAISLPDANAIQVLLGKGDGTFRAMPSITASAISYVETGDFNNDGNADLVLVNYGSFSLTILLGNGDGTFTTGATISVNGPIAVAVGDYNNDGNADLAVISYTDQAVNIFLGNGDGSFTPVSTSPSTGYEPFAITAGDFNGDGVLDLAVTNYNGGNPIPGSVNVLLGNGDGTFTAGETLTTGPLPGSIAVADFNGDGKADLVTSNAGNNTESIFLGNGDGTFAAPLSPSAGKNSLYSATGDFTGFGLPDLAIANNTSSFVTILLTMETQAATATATGIDPQGSGQQLVDANYKGNATYAASTSPTVTLMGSGNSASGANK